MRVVIAIDHFREGGAERVAAIVANKLCEEHDVHAVVMEDGIRYPLNTDRITIHKVEFPRGRVSRKIMKFVRFRKTLLDINPDVVYAFGNVMSIYSALALKMSNSKARLISSERTDPTREPSNPISRFLRDKAYAMSDCLVCQTEWVKEYFAQKMHTKLVVIPNPITPNLPQWSGSESKTIMTACRLAEQKNLYMLLNAFYEVVKIHPNYNLVIYGDGEMRKELTDKIAFLGLSENVSLPGFSNDVHNAMVNSYMYVSSSDYEGISNSMLEALGIGIPTICTDCPVGGVRMFIRNEKNGILTPVGDTKAMTDAMLKMIEDKQFAQSCSVKSKQINDDINVDKIAKMWLSCINMTQ